VSSAETYKLDELAAAAGVSARTVRYYVQRGLLPAPAFRGRDTVYDGNHLRRLRAIKRLQEQYLPLDAIQVELERRGAWELEGLPVVPPPAAQPALAPATQPAPAPERWLRWELAPGVELLAAERVGVTEELARELRGIIERHAAAGGARWRTR
jgi:DNA-binding transcriptional MerR regulator